MLFTAYRIYSMIMILLLSRETRILIKKKIFKVIIRIWRYNWFLRSIWNISHFRWVYLGQTSFYQNHVKNISWRDSFNTWFVDNNAVSVSNLIQRIMRSLQLRSGFLSLRKDIFKITDGELCTSWKVYWNHWVKLTLSLISKSAKTIFCILIWCLLIETKLQERSKTVKYNCVE